MGTNKISHLAIFICLLASCNFGYQKTPSGVYYKIMGDGNTPPAVEGEVLKMQVKQVYGDSLLRDTRNFIHQYQVIDSSKMSADAFIIFKKVRVSDSIVFRAPADSTLKRKFPKIKADYIETQIKVITILANRDSAIRDEEYENKQLKEKYQPKTPR